MKMIREGLTTQEMGDIVRVREAIREGLFTNTIGSEELSELMQGLSTPFGSLITVLAARRAKLTKMLKSIERERDKVKKALDLADLSAPGNIEKLEKLEKMINDYCFLNEGLRRARGGRRVRG
ncbi:hypothetical protein [Anaeroselena agilis]|uniref:Uncharacterized protein n=1 Tax=Anaeroselena agilis TaxID=3063788 RepID=A0ABU3NSU0_9FIRM|nr:hypothetical protein [Selenomonadales bacterium 4137-cl]